MTPWLLDAGHWAYQDVSRLCRLVRYSDALSSRAALPSIQDSGRSEGV